jgi:hypothetical protein
MDSHRRRVKGYIGGAHTIMARSSGYTDENKAAGNVKTSIATGNRIRDTSQIWMTVERTRGGRRAVASPSGVVWRCGGGSDNCCYR